MNEKPDPLLSIMAEWRNFGETSGLRTKDMAVKAIYKHLESDNIKLAPTGSAKIQGLLMDALKKDEPLKQFLESISGQKIPSMNEEQVKTIQTLGAIAADLEKRVQEKQDRQPNRPLSLYEIEQFMSEEIEKAPFTSYFETKPSRRKSPSKDEK